jgi:hypothetical protein
MHNLAVWKWVALTQNGQGIDYLETALQNTQIYRLSWRL